MRPMELNAEQRRAVEAVRGPVCILAGAGSGKTTTITHRIANQVASGAFLPSQILAVTFTEKAAGEMKARLERLGVSGVRASTFHSAALSQLRYFRPEAVGRILASKALVVRQIANSLPAPYKFRAAGDLATEIEWAHNRRIAPERYLDALGEHTPPIPPDLMLRVYRRYEERKRAEGLMDFEDLLERAIETFDDEQAVAELRERYVAFTVDEYQDVNLLQQTLLDRWLGPRDDLCVVGDDYQSIYGFTGATPEHLLRVPERFPHAEVIRLEENYRSTPAGARAGEPPGAEAGRGGEGAADDAAGRPGAGGAAVSDRGGRGRVPRRDDSGRRAARSRRSPSSAERTPAWPSSSRCCTRRGSRTRARRCSRARLRGACCALSTRRHPPPRASGRSPSSTAGCRGRSRGSATVSSRGRPISRCS